MAKSIRSKIKRMFRTELRGKRGAPKQHAREERIAAKLKASLKAQGSIVACSTEPRCFLDTGICSVAFCAETNRWVRVPCELYDVEMARGA